MGLRSAETEEALMRARQGIWMTLADVLSLCALSLALTLLIILSSEGLSYVLSFLDFG